MRQHSPAVGAGVWLGLAQLTASVAVAAAVSTSDLARCAAITGADQRLACYDTLARRALPPPPAAPAAAAAPSAAPKGAAAASGAALPAAQSAPATPAPQNFGLSRHEQSAPDQPQDIRAVVTNMTTDRMNNVYLTLDNGQVWTFNEGNSPVRAGDTVTIRHGALSSFLLVTADHHSYHVRRTQ